MVFWTSYPFWKVIRTKERFTKQRFTKQNIESAYPLTYEWIDNTSSKESTERVMGTRNTTPR